MGTGNKIVHRHDIIEYKDFMTKEECQNLVEYFNSSKNDWQLSCFYESYVMDPLAPLKTYNGFFTKEYFDISLRERLKEYTLDASPQKLRNLTLSAHKWEKGASARKHSDNSELDGTPNAWSDNKFVTIIYLNDEYGGGHLEFDDHKISIRPETGTMIAFDPGFTNLHSVSEITYGTRYTMLASWDYENSDHSEEYMIKKKMEREKQKYLQDKQKEEWNKGNKYA
jgi:hypothetical protein